MRPAGTGYVTLIANYLPFQDPYGGPNYFFLDPDAFYRIHVDNDGDGVEDITFQFRVAAAAGGHQGAGRRQERLGPAVQHRARSRPGRSRANLNIIESYTMSVIRGAVNGARHRRRLRHQPRDGQRPVRQAGRQRRREVDPRLRRLCRRASSRSSTSRAAAGNAIGRVFVGQRKESFAVNLGEIFDLVNLNPRRAPQRGAEPAGGQEHHHVRARGARVPA